MKFSQPRDLLKFPLHTLSVAVYPLETVHVSVENLPNLLDGVLAILRLDTGVQVADNFFQILAHPRQLSIQILGKLKKIKISSLTLHCLPSTYRIYFLSLGVDVSGVGERSLQWFQYFLQLRLLPSHEVQLVLESLLVQPHCGDLLVQADNLVSVLDE